MILLFTDRHNYGAFFKNIGGGVWGVGSYSLSSALFGWVMFGFLSRAAFLCTGYERPVAISDARF